MKSNPNVVPGVLSVVIRSASVDRLMLLEETLFSLAVQQWARLDVVVVLQEPSPSFLAAVQTACRRLPWGDGMATRVIPVPCAAGFDGRAQLLVRGVEESNGQYLAFLDDDDVVYHDAYVRLIGRLMTRRDAVIAVGGTRVAILEDADDYYVVRQKSSGLFPKGTHRFELFDYNITPIHSYVVDRTRVPEHVFTFSDEHVPLEDYEFLLRLAEIGPFDFAEASADVAEYRFHKNGTVSPQADGTAVISEQLALARGRIDRSADLAQMTITKREWNELKARFDVTRPYTSGALAAERSRGTESLKAPHPGGPFLVRGAVRLNARIHSRPALVRPLHSLYRRFRRL